MITRKIKFKYTGWLLFCPVLVEDDSEVINAVPRYDWLLIPMILADKLHLIIPLGIWGIRKLETPIVREGWDGN